MNNSVYLVIFLLISLSAFIFSENRNKKIINGVAALIFMTGLVDIKVASSLGEIKTMYIILYICLPVFSILLVTQYYRKAK